MIDISKEMKIPAAFLKRTARHEIGHAIYYHRNKIPFEFVTIIEDEINWGFVRPVKNPIDYQGFYDVYYFRDEIYPRALRRIKKNLKRNVEINLAGKLFEMYEKFDYTLEDYLNDYFFEMHVLDINKIAEEYLIVEKEIVQQIRPHIIDKYSDQFFFKINPEMTIAHLITSMYYGNSVKRTYNFIEKTAKSIIEYIEQNEKFIEYLTSALIKHETLNYKEFVDLYNNYNITS